MRFFSYLKGFLPKPSSAGLAALAAVLLILAFPDFEFWFLAPIAPAPFFFAVRSEKESVKKAFTLGWLFGTIFFFGTCWWLTHAPITYASLPWAPVYFLMLGASLAVGIFPALFSTLFAILLKRFGDRAILATPFLWTFTEFLRMWLTGNNWNAVGYSQFSNFLLRGFASYGGVLLVSFLCVAVTACYLFPFIRRTKNSAWTALVPQLLLILSIAVDYSIGPMFQDKPVESDVIAIQPNVPMSGLTIEKYKTLLKRHIELAETELSKTKGQKQKLTVIFPESPMMFEYGRDEDLRKLFKDFALRNDTALLFNSAERTSDDRRILNSAVMIDRTGEKIAQYDKIYLVPFGEYIPFPEPVASWMPAFVGNFQYGDEYDLLPFGEAKGGIMICFESHFGNLSREYVRRGADVLIEMTNDGYLGQTPVLRQHLANSVFRAVETGRPLLRVTNVGVTAFINERGDISQTADVYTEAVRRWPVSKSGGHQTFYVRFGDWFAWFCSLVSLGLMIFCRMKNLHSSQPSTESFKNPKV